MADWDLIWRTSYKVAELLALLAGIKHWHKWKHTYFKWFIYYLAIIVLSEINSQLWIRNFFPKAQKAYFNFFVIPLEYLFFLWLYCKKILQWKGYKWLWMPAIYILSFILGHVLLQQPLKAFSTVSITVGNILLLIVATLYFVKMIQSDEILGFSRKMSFYVSLGVLIFYLGNFPFKALYTSLAHSHLWLWYNFYYLFVITLNIMYLLFAAGFIWANQK